MQKIRISNLPHWITEIHLKQFFHSCGKIVHASVALDQQTLRPLGYGFLIFADDAATELALGKDGKLLDGVAISVVLDESEVEEAETVI